VEALSDVMAYDVSSFDKFKDKKTYIDEAKNTETGSGTYESFDLEFVDIKLLYSQISCKSLLDPKLRKN
jgi:hypothetical protein